MSRDSNKVARVVTDRHQIQFSASDLIDRFVAKEILEEEEGQQNGM